MKKLILLIILVVTGFGIYSQNNVSIQPASKTVALSATFTTTIEIAQVNNLGGFELEVDFDPLLLQANSVILGSFLGSTGRTVFPLASTINNTTGLIEFAATTLGASPPGPNGTGVLMTIVWTATSTLSSTAIAHLILQNVQVTQPNGTVIPVSLQHGAVTISLPVPQNTTVSNVTITSGQIVCYNAIQTITVAGNGTIFTVQNGGSATMIAGQNILYLPGTTVQSGGFMWGYIAPTGPWCVTPSMPAVATSASENLTGIEQLSFKVYPNPTTGKFILELTGKKRITDATVRIYNMQGMEVLIKQLTGDRISEFSLESQSPGIYLVSVLCDGKQESFRIIRQ